MRALRVWLLAISLLTLSQPAIALTSVGGPSCDEWIKGRADKGRPMVVYQHWVLGYFSGISSGTGTEFWTKDGNNIDTESVHLWIDNFCKENPRKEVLETGKLLFVEKTQIRKSPR